MPQDQWALRLQDTTFIPGYRSHSLGDLVLIMRCKVTEELCTARLKVASSNLGKRLMSVLAKCKGLSLAQAGNRVIPEATG